MRTPAVPGCDPGSALSNELALLQAAAWSPLLIRTFSRTFQLSSLARDGAAIDAGLAGRTRRRGGDGHEPRRFRRGRGEFSRCSRGVKRGEKSLLAMSISPESGDWMSC